MTPFEKFIEQLDDIQERIQSDFKYYNGQQSQIDRRLNELGQRGDIEKTAQEMAELLAERQRVKTITLRLLPIRDFFKHYPEVGERMDNFRKYDR
ncbi:hypothetical protein [Bacillus sp. 37MA]|uniref:hypothetical protein n=1 Tax=Bacillus sp. 37MA TaxID=1132442 RepID=UPI000372F6AA|nr:hypothetical protein [Bacillus sp. 37MA]